MPYSHMAEHLRSKGRGDDTMLVHMTPHEVGGLQALAMAHGGSLTINPDTGLPEAGWLGKLLPTILGVAGMAFGIPPVWMGVLGAVGGTAITGNLKEGLMAGLGAFGGASMGGALGLGGALGKVGASLSLPGATALGAAAPVANAATLAGGNAAAATAGRLATTGAGFAGGAGAGTSLIGSGLSGIGDSLAGGAGSVLGGGLSGIGSSLAGTGAPAVLSQGINVAGKTGLAGLAQGFGDSAKLGLPGGIISKAAPMLAAQGVLGGISGALAPTYKASKDKTPPDEYGYTGPYTSHREEIGSALPVPGAPLAAFDPTKAYGTERYYGGTSYTDSSGKAYIPGQKTTPTAANATSFMAQPTFMGLPIPNRTADQNPISGQLTPEQLASLQRYGTINPPQGYADGGQVGGQMSDSTYTFPSQTTAQQPQVVPQPPMQFSQQQQPQQQPSPYMQQSAYGQPQQGNNPNSMGSIQGLPGLKRGGEVPLKHGSFVVDARTVAELGNGSSGAGQDLLARLGGVAIRGPGDGVSDSVRANIGGTQQARVARDEVQFGPDAVQRLGKGSHQRGTQKLYALMNRAQTARKSAKRGQDTGLRRGVA